MSEAPRARTKLNAPDRFLVSVPGLPWIRVTTGWRELLIGFVALLLFGALTKNSFGWDETLLYWCKSLLIITVLPVLTFKPRGLNFDEYVAIAYGFHTGQARRYVATWDVPSSPPPFARLIRERRQTKSVGRTYIRAA